MKLGKIKAGVIVKPAKNNNLYVVPTSVLSGSTRLCIAYKLSEDRFYLVAYGLCVEFVLYKGGINNIAEYCLQELYKYRYDPSKTDFHKVPHPQTINTIYKHIKNLNKFYNIPVSKTFAIKVHSLDLYCSEGPLCISSIFNV